MAAKAAKAILSEFQLRNCRLSYHNSADFTESPWFGVLGVLIYRFSLAIYCLAWLIVSGHHPSNGQEKWFIYLTNWSFLLLSLYFACAAILTAVYYRGEWQVGEYDVQENDALKPRSRGSARAAEDNSRSSRPSSHGPLDMKHEEPMSWYHSVLWFIQVIAANSALSVSLAYWTTVYPKLTGYTPTGVDVNTHLVNSLFVLIDVSLSNVPVRLYHIFYPFLYFLCYIIFLVLYWANDGTNAYGRPYVYWATDFTNNPGAAAGFAFGFPLVFQTVSQISLLLLYKLRCWGSDKLEERRADCVFREGTDIIHEENEIDV